MSDPVAARAAALYLLRPPAFLLLAVGLVSLGVSVAVLSTVAGGSPVPFGPGGSELAPPALDTGRLLALGGWALGGLLEVWGALCALRLRRPGWARAGAAAALLPLVPLCFLGAPVGLWMLFSLRRPEVRGAFGRGG